MADRRESEPRSVSISEFVKAVSARLEVRPLSRDDLLSSHRLNSSRVQKLGLALSGFADKIHRGRVQIYGNSERSYISRLSSDEMSAAFARLDKENISCILVTAGIEPPLQLTDFAGSHNVPVLATLAPSSEAITAIATTLAECLAPEATIHGTLMEVFGIGVLIVGESGIGKSECALDLIARGHRLISDDSVKIRRVDERLTGSAPENIRDFLEIRGLGIINARDLFGVSALASSSDIQFCLEFSEWSTHSSDRLGLEPSLFSILGTDIQKYPLPVRPGRNLATLAEAAVRVFVSRKDGPNAVEKLISGHNEALAALKRS
ncbi:MAG TPA: HPr(Ser) kinase/phosphatase [Pyrinomonadaceae bacterium]